MHVPSGLTGFRVFVGFRLFRGLVRPKAIPPLPPAYAPFPRVPTKCIPLAPPPTYVATILAPELGTPAGVDAVPVTFVVVRSLVMKYLIVIVYGRAAIASVLPGHPYVTVSCRDVERTGCDRNVVLIELRLSSYKVCGL